MMTGQGRTGHGKQDKVGLDIVDRRKGLDAATTPIDMHLGDRVDYV